MNLLEELNLKIEIIGESTGAFEIPIIDTVMRRQYHDPERDEILDIIDFFPKWTPWGYGMFRAVDQYMNTPTDEALFQIHAKIKIADIPIFREATSEDWDKPHKRRQNKPHQREVRVTPFRLLIQPVENTAGEKRKIIRRYLSIEPKDTSAIAKGRPLQDPSDKKKYWASLTQEEKQAYKGLENLILLVLKRTNYSERGMVETLLAGCFINDDKTPIMGKRRVSFLRFFEEQ